MRKIFILLFVSSCGLFSCSDQKRTPDKSELIEVSEQMHIDTVETEPGETLCNEDVDQVLRHYPELYRATKKAKTLFEKWVESQRLADLPIDLDVLAVGGMLDDALSNASGFHEDAVADSVSAVDHLYLQLIDQAPVERKSDIGRARKAWMLYKEQLDDLASAVPEGCRSRYQQSLAQRISQLPSILQQTKK